MAIRFSFRKQQWMLSAAVAAAFTSLTGCDMAERDPYGAHLSFTTEAISVTKWEDYKAALQPNFILKEDDAYAKAVPTASRVQDSALQALRTKAGVQAAPASALPAGFGKKDESFAGTNLPAGYTDDASTPTGAAPDVFSADTKVDTNPYLAYLAASALFQEVKLINRYIVDANLEKDYQPYIVQFMVNQDIRGGSKSFDSEIIISFFGTPLAESNEGGGETQTFILTKHVLEKINQSLLTDTTKAAIKQDVINKGITHPNVFKSLIQKNFSKDGKELEELQGIIKNLDEFNKSLPPSTEVETDKLPLVRPMLVTDQVESSLRASRAEELQQFGMAVAAGYAGIGGNIDLDQVSRNIRSSLRSDVNNRFSVHRINDNTIRVHFGAQRVPAVKAGDDYVADEGNHRVSLLVLVPKAWVKDRQGKVYFGAQMHVWDPMTGKRYDAAANTTVDSALSSIAPSIEQRKQNIPGNQLFDAARLHAIGLVSKDKIADQMGLDNQLGGSAGLAQLLTRWERYVRAGKYKEFYANVHLTFDSIVEPTSTKNLDPLINSLWHQMSELSIGSRYVTGSFSAPQAPAPGFGLTNAAFTLDDGKATTLILPGVQDIDTDKVTGTWTLMTKEIATPITLSSTNIAKDGKNQLQIQFDSLVGMKLEKADPDPSSKITLHYSDTTVSDATIIEVPYVATGDSKIIGLTINSATDKLPAGKDVELDFDFEPSKTVQNAITKEVLNDANLNAGKFYVMSIKGASITLPAGSPLSRIDSMPAFSYAVTSKGLAKMTVSSVVPDGEITFSFTAPNGLAKPDPIVIKGQKSP